VDQDVVHEAAVLVEQAGVLGLAMIQAVRGVGGDVFDQLEGFGSAHFDFAHVADVEEADSGAHGGVFVDDTGVLDGHVPAAEIHHLRARRAVDIVERRPLQF